MGFISIPHILAMIGCSVFSLGCAAPHANPYAPYARYAPSARSAISIERPTSSSPSTTTVVTTADGSTTRAQVVAPYGISSRVVSQTVNGKTTTYDTTTPLTEADLDAMQARISAREAAFQKQVAQMEEQQKAMERELFDQFDHMEQMFPR